jgi:hypothetical protein
MMERRKNRKKNYTPAWATKTAAGICQKLKKTLGGWSARERGRKKKRP